MSIHGRGGQKEDALLLMRCLQSVGRRAFAIHSSVAARVLNVPVDSLGQYLGVDLIEGLDYCYRATEHEDETAELYFSINGFQSLAVMQRSPAGRATRDFLNALVEKYVPQMPVTEEVDIELQNQIIASVQPGGASHSITNRDQCDSSSNDKNGNGVSSITGTLERLEIENGFEDSTAITKVDWRNRDLHGPLIASRQPLMADTMVPGPPSTAGISAASADLALMRSTQHLMKLLQPPVDRSSEEQQFVHMHSGDPVIIYTQRYIGSGATGTVFEGWYQGRLVAVKRMEMREKATLRELDIALKSGVLSHPNLTKVFGFKIEFSLVYLIMERCDFSLSATTPGGSHLLRQALSNEKLQRILCQQLLGGLAHLHGCKVAHRDLKPSNVLVRRDSFEDRLSLSDGQRVKLLDQRNDAMVARVLNTSSSTSSIHSTSDEHAGGGFRAKPLTQANAKPLTQARDYDNLADSVTLHICDMGLSKRKGANMSLSTLGDVGTHGWRAPELQHSHLVGPQILEESLEAKDDPGTTLPAERGGENNEDLESHNDADTRSDHVTTSGTSAEAADMFAAGLLLFHSLSGGQHVFEMPHGVISPRPADLFAACQRLQLAFLLLHPRIGRAGYGRVDMDVYGASAAQRLRRCVTAVGIALRPASSLLESLVHFETAGITGDDSRFEAFQASRLEVVARSRQARIDDWYQRYHQTSLAQQQTMQARLLDRLQWHTHWQCIKCQELNRYPNPQTFNGETWANDASAQPHAPQPKDPPGAGEVAGMQPAPTLECLTCRQVYRMNGLQRPGRFYSVSPEAAALIASLLHPSPQKRPTASQALESGFFALGEALQSSDRIEAAQVSLGKVIGRGSFGSVRKARWRDTEVAVKILGSTGTGIGATDVSDFQREVLCLKALRHGNIVQYMGWFSTTTADPALKSLSRWLYMALDAARGICFLHGASVVHRDIKPSNCLVGRGGIVKVADFGLSTFLAAASGLPARGAAKGTPAYCAPEQLLEQSVHQAADAFAFGVVLWEMFTKSKPHKNLLDTAAAQFGAGEGQLLLRHEESRISGKPILPVEGIEQQLAEFLQVPFEQLVPSPKDAELATTGSPTVNSGLDPKHKQCRQLNKELQRMIVACLSYAPSERPVFGGKAGIVVTLEQVLSISKVRGSSRRRQ